MTPKAPHASHHRVLASERQVVEIQLDGSFQVIGERINDGQKELQAELRAGKLDLVRAMAREQERNGAAILDVNMGTNGIDEKEMMLKAIYEVTGVSGLPSASIRVRRKSWKRPCASIPAGLGQFHFL